MNAIDIIGKIKALGIMNQIPIYHYLYLALVRKNINRFTGLKDKMRNTAVTSLIELITL